MSRTFFHIPRVTFARPLTVGPARFLDAATLAAELEPALSRVVTSPLETAAHDDSRRRLVEWGNDAALEIAAGERGRADEMASESMAWVRFASRPHITVNVDTHRFGLAGEHGSGLRERLVLFDRQPAVVAPGWNQVGGWPEFNFDDDLIAAIEADPITAWIGSLLDIEPLARTEGQRRAIRAITLLDRGFRSQDTDQRILLSAIAVESLFSRLDVPKNQPQTMAIARRIAYLSCGAGCGRLKAHCIYTQQERPPKPLLKELIDIAGRGDGWRCSAFLHIAAPTEAIAALRYPPLFTARNAIAHEGGVHWEGRTWKHLVRVADQAVRSGLDWLAAHPDSSMAHLDAEIDRAGP